MEGKEEHAREEHCSHREPLSLKEPAQQVYISDAVEERSLSTADDQEEYEPLNKRVRTHSSVPAINNAVLSGIGRSKFDHARLIAERQEDSDDSNFLLPVPENLREDSWLVENVQTLKLGMSGMFYSGKTLNKKMHGFGRLNLENGNQFFEGNWEMNQLAELTFCQLICDPGLKLYNQIISIIKQKNDHLLTVFESDYIAKVALKDISTLDFTGSVANVKKVFFEKLTVLEVVVNKLMLRQNTLMEKLSTSLVKAVEENADPILRADILINLGSSENVDSLSYFANFLLSCDFDLPLDVHIIAADVADCKNRYLSNTYIFSPYLEKLRSDLAIILKKIYSHGMAQHVRVLIGKCPKALPNLMANIMSMPPSKTCYISNEDIGVFEHLVSQPCFEHYTTFFENLAERYCVTVNNIEEGTRPSSVVPVMSPVYGFLVKSFWEIILEIVQLAGYEYKDMLKCESLNWKLKDFIVWPQSEETDTQKRKFLNLLNSSENTLYHRSLEIQYNTLFQLMKHFSPENYKVNKKSNEFEFHVLGKDFSWWEKGMKTSENRGKLANILKNMSNERLAWLYLLDRTIYEVFMGNSKYQILLKPYNLLLQGQISFIEKSTADSYETFRVVTHSILKFIISTASYFREAHEKPGVDVEILMQQTWTFSTATRELEEDPSTFSNFRDLIAEYNRYLSLRLSISIEATTGHFSTLITQMMQKFMRIVVTSLKKSVPTTALVGYLRSLNDFLEDFKNIDFLAMWFVKNQFYQPQILEKVNNKLSAGANCSYRVIHIEKFVQIMQILENQPVPHHFIILVVSELLACIEVCLEKEWQCGEMELQVIQLECTGLLLDAIRKSFLYLKEQPDYVDFEIFKKDSVEPFVQIVNDCTTVNEMKLRTGMVGESFWYLRKMDEIGIDEALKLFRTINTLNASNQLHECYNLYMSNYNDRIANYKSLLSGGKSHAESLSEVIQTFGKPNVVHFSVWTEEFKIKKIPVMLASLSAVWSIMVSKDICSSGKFLKPHCIQILCILRLLSVDRSMGPKNHLAQVLTGQGKSLILGLLSSILAATGHDVKVLCYSGYLSTRDQIDFNEFFKSFQLAHKIEYGTFEDMANDLLTPISNGRKKSIRELVTDRVLNHSEWSITGGVSVSNYSVLLIDEIDVFFTEKFYGDAYCPIITTEFEALAQLQEMIWTCAVEQKHSKEQIEQMAIRFIYERVAVGDQAFLEFNAFLNKPGTIPLLTYEDDRMCVTTYTNWSLFKDELLQMVDCALRIASPSRRYDWDRTGYMIDSEGLIRSKDDDGICYPNSVNSYHNIFNYFKIKQLNFDCKNFRNFGYLILNVGEISYARLPSQFKLILGVSGTLTNLREWEKTAIKSYNIHDFSVLPSFYGDSNLKFDEDVDFYYFSNEKDWLREMYDRANKIVGLNRAVIIFFRSDTTMNLFKKEYKTKFDRLNEITENTKANLRDAIIDESGIPCTVTLATRGMGRGVDFKSSLAVEKNGGVHVIQTFFSVDVKEEIQIRGRTARKDNKGSYELMICREHLVKEGLICKDDRSSHDYRTLGTIRINLSDQKGAKVNKDVALRERNHETTMQFFGLMPGNPPSAQPAPQPNRGSHCPQRRQRNRRPLRRRYY